jgi:outer membrane protein assembly factor BamB
MQSHRDAVNRIGEYFDTSFWGSATLNTRYSGPLLAAVTTMLLSAWSCSESSAPVVASTGPHVAWKVSINDRNPDVEWGGIPVASDGKLFIAEGPNIAALNTATGARLWTTRVRQNLAPVTSKILWHQARLFFPDVPDVLCLDANTGAILWRFAPDTQAVNAESAVDDRAMYIGTRSHKVYALSVDDGHPLWIVDVGPTWEHFGMIAGLSLAGDTLYAAASRYLVHNGYLRSAVIVALDKSTGRELWRYESPGDRHDVVSAPVVAGNNLIIDDMLFASTFAVDRFTGREVWRVPAAPGGFGPQDAATVAGDTAFIASNDAFVYAIRASTGEVLWKSRSRGGSFIGGTTCGNYVLANAQGIDVFNRATGRPLSSFLTPTDENGAFPTSHFASERDKAFVTGILWAWAIQC